MITNCGHYTYRYLADYLECMGNNLADVAVGRMMDIVAESTGKYPDWNDIAADWVVKNCFGG